MYNYTGNKNAEKWTTEVVQECLYRIEEEAHKDKTNYLGTALMRLRISRRTWSYWKAKFAYDEDIMDHMNIIDGIFETKLTEGSLYGELNTAAAIFCLKHNYQWNDRPQNEQPQAALPHHREPLMICELPNQEALIVPYPLPSSLSPLVDR